MDQNTRYILYKSLENNNVKILFGKVTRKVRILKIEIRNNTLYWPVLATILGQIWYIKIIETPIDD